MSRTVYFEFHGEGFWAYDVASGILAQELMEAAVASLRAHPWLQHDVEHWAANAVVSDFGFHLNENWNAQELRVIVGLLDSLTHRLRTQSDFPSKTYGTDFRGAETFPTEPVVQLADATGDLLNGTLRRPPPGHWWFYGLVDGPRTLKRSESAKP